MGCFVAKHRERTSTFLKTLSNCGQTWSKKGLRKSRKPRKYWVFTYQVTSSLGEHMFDCLSSVISKAYRLRMFFCSRVIVYQYVSLVQKVRQNRVNTGFSGILINSYDSYKTSLTYKPLHCQKRLYRTHCSCMKYISNSCHAILHVLLCLTIRDVSN